MLMEGLNYVCFRNEKEGQGEWESENGRRNGLREFKIENREEF